MNEHIKGLNELVALFQLCFIGLTLGQIQSIVIMLSSAATFAVYFIINYDKIQDFFKKKDNGKS